MGNERARAGGQGFCSLCRAGLASPRPPTNLGIRESCSRTTPTTSQTAQLIPRPAPEPHPSLGAAVGLSVARATLFGFVGVVRSSSHPLSRAARATACAVCAPSTLDERGIARHVVRASVARGGRSVSAQRGRRRPSCAPQSHERAPFGGPARTTAAAVHALDRPKRCVTQRFPFTPAYARARGCRLLRAYLDLLRGAAAPPPSEPSAAAGGAAKVRPAPEGAASHA